MPVLKKAILIFFCIALTVSVFVACDRNDNDPSETSAETSAETSVQTSAETSTETSIETSEETSEETTTNSVDDNVSKNEWDAMIAVSKFENVTFTLDAAFVSGYSGTSYSEIKLDGNKGIMDGRSMDAETIANVREIYLKTVLAIVENFDNFAQGEAENNYTAIENIVYNVSVMGYDAKITAKNASVELDDDMNVVKIVCNMTQEFEENGVAKTYVLDVVFTFADYGTTVVA